MMDAAMWGGIGSDLLGGLGGLFGGNSNPSDAASPYLDKIPGMLQGVYSPYMSAGMGALGGLQGYENNGLNAGNSLQQQLGRLTNDPTGLMNSWGKTFHSSPGYNYQVNQALGAANRAAAAGGMAGSPAEQQSLAGTVNGMANQDYYNYLSHAQNLYGMGLQGLQGMYNTGAQIGSNIYDTGANMANEYGTNLAQSYMNQGNLAYAGQENQNQSQGGMMGALGSGLGGLFGMGMQKGWFGNGSGGGSSPWQQAGGALAGMAPYLAAL